MCARKLAPAVILACLLFSGSSLPAQVDTAWVRRYNGPGDGNDLPVAVLVDPVGNVIVTGGSTDATSQDIATIKYAPDGTALWVRRYDGPAHGSDWADALGIDAAGNLYVTGTSRGIGTMDDYVTLKYHSDGTLLWDRRYSSPGDSLSSWDGAVSLSVDSHGNAYVTGISGGEIATLKYSSGGTLLWVHRGGVDGVPRDLETDQQGNTYVICIDNHDYVLVRYNSLGDVVWIRQYEAGGPFDDVFALDVDRSGDIYVTGVENGDNVTIKYDPHGDTLWARRYPGGGSLSHEIKVDGNGNAHVIGNIDEDFLTIKYDTEGDLLWDRRFDPGGAEEGTAALDIDATGNVYVTGRGWSGRPGDYDYVTLKYDQNGNLLWDRRYDGPPSHWIKWESDAPQAIAVSATGDVIVTGGAGQLAAPDYATVKYSPDGILQWERHYDGPGRAPDYAVDLAVDTANNVVVTGYSSGGRSSGYDFSTVKYDPHGDTLWIRRYDGPSHDEAVAVELDAEGNVYVTGTSDGGASSLDYLTLKYSPRGDLLWERRYDSPEVGYERPSDLRADSAGNVYVTGTCPTGYLTVKYNAEGELAWDRVHPASIDTDPVIGIDAEGNVYVGGESGILYLIIKYDRYGSLQWERQHDAGVDIGLNYFADLEVDRAGNVYVIGTSENAEPWEGYDSRFDYATIKYNSTGDLLWEQLYDGSSDSADGAMALAVDAVGNVYVTGYSSGQGTSLDFATVKYSASGTLLWVTRYNGPGNGHDLPTAVVVDRGGGVYVTGRSQGTSSHDYATLKYDPYGNLLWSQRYNGPGDGVDVASAIHVGPEGNVYVTGTSWDAGSREDYATIKFVQALTPAAVTVTVGILQNPLLSSYLDVYVAVDQPLLTVPLVTVDADTLDVTLVTDGGAPIYSAGYYLTGSGTVTIHAAVTDAAGLESDTTEVFESFVATPSGGLLKSADGHLRLALPANAIDRERFFLLFTEVEEDGQLYDLRPNLMQLARPARLSIDPGTATEPRASVEDLGIFRQRDDGSWEPLPTHVEQQTGMLVAEIDRLGRFQVRPGVSVTSSPLPRSPILEQNCPNPFNAGTIIKFTLDQPGHVALEVFNILGQRVVMLLDEKRESGTHHVAWDGTDGRGRPLASGIYYYRLRNHLTTQTRKMVVLK